MAKYQFEVDGHNYEVEAPEGVSPEDAYQGLSEQLGAKTQPVEPPKAETPKQEEPSFFEKNAQNVKKYMPELVLGLPEAGLSVASGFAGAISGGLSQSAAALYEGTLGAGLDPSDTPGAHPDAPKEFGRDIAESMTYQPRTEMGKKIVDIVGVLGVPFEYASEKIRNLEKRYSGQTTGSDIALGLASALSVGVKKTPSQIVKETKMSQAEKTRLGQNKQKIDQMHDAVTQGFRFSPSAIEKATGVKTFLSKHEETIGSAKIEGQLSLHNQGVADNLARKDLGIPENEPLSVENIDKQITKLSSDPAYEQMRNLNQGRPINLDATFENSIRDAVKTDSPLASERAALKSVQDEIIADIDAGVADRGGIPGMLGGKTKGYGAQTASQLMSKISALRAKATKLYQSAAQDQTGAFTRDKADAYISAASAIEDYMMNRAESEYGKGSAMINNFRDARTKIAQAYTWRDLVDPESTSVDFNKLRTAKFDPSKKMLTGILESLRGLARGSHTKNMFKGIPQQREAGMSYLGSQAMIHWLGKTLAGAGGAGAGGAYVGGAPGAAAGAALGATLTGGIEAARGYATSGRATRKALEYGSKERKSLSDKARAVDLAANKHAKAILALQQAEKEREEKRKKRMREFNQ